MADLTPEAYALLEAISGPESKGAPNVPFEVYHMANEDIRSNCRYTGNDVISGCVVLETDPAEIYIDWSLSEEMAACVLMHEKAHLPPNNWTHG